MSYFSSELDLGQVAEVLVEKRLLSVMLNGVPPRFERIVRLRFGIGVRKHSRAEVAAMFGVNVSRIRGLERRALHGLVRPAKRVVRQVRHQYDAPVGSAGFVVFPPRGLFFMP